MRCLANGQWRILLVHVRIGPRDRCGPDAEPNANANGHAVALARPFADRITAPDDPPLAMDDRPAGDAPGHLPIWSCGSERSLAYRFAGARSQTRFERPPASQGGARVSQWGLAHRLSKSPAGDETGVSVSFFKRLGSHGPGPAARPAGKPGAGPSEALKYALNPTLIPPEPVDYGGHRDEVEAFIASLGQMNAAEVANVHQRGLASGAHTSPRWAEVASQIVAQASVHHLELGRIAAQRRASQASAASSGRSGNQWVVTDYCAGVWAEVLVLRDHLPRQIVATAFEPWQDVLQAPDWLGLAES